MSMKETRTAEVQGGGFRVNGVPGSPRPLSVTQKWELLGGFEPRKDMIYLSLKKIPLAPRVENEDWGQERGA